MVEDKETKISDEEAALYDRQIRLWGCEAQNRLRNSSVLLVGLSPLGAEVAKNLMLAGIKKLVLLDSSKTGNETSQFLAAGAPPSSNVAVASLERCKELNPLVDVRAEAFAIESASELFFEEFDLVCLIDQQYNDCVRVDSICRRLKKKFFSGSVWGYFGFLCQDLGSDYEYAEEIVPQQGEEDISTKHPHAVVGMDGKNETKPTCISDMTKVLVKKSINFPTLENAFCLNWGDLVFKGANKYANMFLLTQVIFKFHEKSDRFPQLSARKEDMSLLIELRDSILDLHSISEKQRSSVCPDNYLNLCFGALVPVCAIVGGFLAQEIIKAASQRDEPINNLLLYDGVDRNASVVRLPPEAVSVSNFQFPPRIIFIRLPVERKMFTGDPTDTLQYLLWVTHSVH